MSKPRIAIMVGLVLLLIIGSIALIKLNSVQNPVEIVSSSELSSLSSDNDTSSSMEPSSSSSNNLTERQREEISLYKEKEKGLIASLATSKWVDSSGIGYLAFDESSWHVFKDGKEIESHTYAVMSTYQVPVAEGAKTLTILSVDTDLGNSMIMLNEEHSNGIITSSYLSSDVFEDAVYHRSEQIEKIEIDKLNDAARAFVGQSDKELYKQIENLVQSAYPSVSKANWSGQMLIDWPSEVGQTVFTLNNAAKTEITAYYSLKDKVWEIAVGNIGINSKDKEVKGADDEKASSSSSDAKDR